MIFTVVYPIREGEGEGEKSKVKSLKKRKYSPDDVRRALQTMFIFPYFNGNINNNRKFLLLF